MLDINSTSASPTVAGRMKVALVHFGGNDEKAPYNLDPIIGLDSRLMPRVLAWVGSKCGFHKLHHVIRNWNNPQLFGYPSSTCSSKVDVSDKRKYYCIAVSAITLSLADCNCILVTLIFIHHHPAPTLKYKPWLPIPATTHPRTTHHLTQTNTKA